MSSNTYLNLTTPWMDTSVSRRRSLVATQRSWRSSPFTCLTGRPFSLHIKLRVPQPPLENPPDEMSEEEIQAILFHLARLERHATEQIWCKFCFKFFFECHLPCRQWPAARCTFSGTRGSRWDEIGVVSFLFVLKGRRQLETKALFWCRLDGFIPRASWCPRLSFSTCMWELTHFEKEQP